MRRWDVNDPTNSTKTESKIGYDIAGSVVFTRDALDHQTTINYNDAFSLNGTTLDAPRSFATFAYPTTVTDADNNSSSLWYGYDFGAKTRAQGPPPQNQSSGIVQTFTYDNAARVKRATVVNTGGYTHYEYGPNYVQAYSSVNTVSADPYSSDSYSFQMVDGLGRVIAASKNHPGSVGGYSAVMTIYDRMGRAVQQSNPTETSASGSQWSATGDDDLASPQGHGWVYTQQTYDWKGRPLLTINPSITGNPNDTTTKEASYSACGCAGSEVVTLEDEVGRSQKVYSDGLGRQWKTEILNLDSTVYSTSVSVYNGRDQVIRVKQYSGQAPAEASSTDVAASCPSGSCQESTLSYDGYGRLQSKHVPEQDASTATVYAYNLDDTVHSVTDARGASATYDYSNNNRRLVNGVVYSAPSGITPTSNSSFEYDAVGNRTSMTDGLGNQSYAYDQLSRLTSETRTFSDPNNSGINGVSKTLSYGYNLAGELTRVTDPTNASIYYSHDAVGRVTSVTGSPYGTGGFGGIPYIEVSQYATNLQYRASGALKSLNYGNGLTLAIGYDARLRPSGFEVGGRPPQFGPPTAMKTQFQYYPDDSPMFSHDLLDERFDRAFAFDQAGAMKEAYSGSEARDFVNHTNSGTATGPFRQTYQHDTFGNLTNRANRFWSHSDTFTANYMNNRRQDPAYQYDAAGHLLHDTDLQYTYDATGGIASIYSPAVNQTITAASDGEGRSVRRIENENGATDMTYYLWSSVIGKVVTELYQNGEKRKGNVYLGGQVLAMQQSAWVVWQHDDPISGTRGVSSRDGGYSIQVAPDPMGVDVGVADPFLQPFQSPEPEPGVASLLGDTGSCGPNPNCTRCYLDGFRIGCAEAMHLIDVGTAQFHTPTTVNVTYTSGRSQTYTGYTDLPPGTFFNSTGGYARAADFVFGLLSGNFNVAVHTAIASADVVRNSRQDVSGHAYGWYGPAFMSAQENHPQNTRVTEQRLTNDQRTIVDDVVKAALGLLDNNEACRDYIRGGSPNSPYTELAQIWANDRFTYFNGYEGDSIAETKLGALFRPARIVLETNFFKDDVGGEVTALKPLGVDARIARIVTILHELKHVTTRKGPHPEGDRRTDETESSYDFDRNIYKKCFGIDIGPEASLARRY